MAKEHSKEALSDWLDEHGPYDLSMMRYGFDKMSKAVEPMDYNAHFECFILKARVLVDFLTGRQKGSDIKTIHFVPGFTAPPRKHIEGVMAKVNDHSAHPSANRPDSDKAKIALEQCREIGLWIEGAMDAFLKSLPADRTWNRAKSRDDLRVPAVLTVSSVVSQSSAPTMTSSISTAAVATTAKTIIVKR